MRLIRCTAKKDFGGLKPITVGTTFTFKIAVNPVPKNATSYDPAIFIRLQGEAKSQGYTVPISAIFPHEWYVEDLGECM